MTDEQTSVGSTGNIYINVIGKLYLYVLNL